MGSQTIYGGPYSYDLGTCSAGHPTNGYGRCEQLETNPPCPTAAQRTTRLLAMANSDVIEIATARGITIPLVHTNVVLVPLIIAVEFP